MTENNTCPICDGEYRPGKRGGPHGLVCDRCDRRAVNEDGDPALAGEAYMRRENPDRPEPEEGVIRMGIDVGDDPVFIDGIKCYRRYRFGGWITHVADEDIHS